MLKKKKSEMTAKEKFLSRMASCRKSEKKQILATKLKNKKEKVKKEFREREERARRNLAAYGIGLLAHDLESVSPDEGENNESEQQCG